MIKRHFLAHTGLLLIGLMLVSCGGSQLEVEKALGNDQVSIDNSLPSQMQDDLVAGLQAEQESRTVEVSFVIPAQQEAEAADLQELKQPFITSYEGERPCLRLELVSENYEDGTRVKPGEYFDKVWRFRNTGSCTWTEGFSVVWVGGDLVPENRVVFFSSYDNFPEDGVKNGELLGVHVWMQAPDQIRKYTGYWMLRSEGGEVFGWGDLGNYAFWVKIAVKLIP